MAHTVQAELLNPAENWPAAHLKHADPVVTYCPAAHVMHEVEAVAPVKPEVFPSAQLMQAVLPVAVEYWPAWQLVQ